MDNDERLLVFDMGSGSEVKKPVLGHKKPVLPSQKKKDIGVEIVVSDKVKQKIE